MPASSIDLDRSPSAFAGQPTGKRCRPPEEPPHCLQSCQNNTKENLTCDRIGPAWCPPPACKRPPSKRLRRPPVHLASEYILPDHLLVLNQDTTRAMQGAHHPKHQGPPQSLAPHAYAPPPGPPIISILKTCASSASAGLRFMPGVRHKFTMSPSCSALHPLFV